MKIQLVNIIDRKSFFNVKTVINMSIIFHLKI